MDKALSMLGLCRRAGFLVFGNDPVCKAAKEKKLRLILTASDFSENSGKKIEKAAQQYEVKLRTLPFSKDELSFAVGTYCGVVAVTDRGFAEKILTCLN